MQRFKRLGVFLHKSPADAAALGYAGVLATLAQSKSVLCVYVREPDRLDVPDPGKFAAEVRQQLPPVVAQATHVEVREGTGVPEILRRARALDLDLIIVGRRLPSEHLGIGSTFSRLARKSPCNVLVVPRDSRPHLGRLLVGVDFSAHARRAIEQAVAIVRASGAARPQLVLHSNSSVGYGYKTLGVTLAEAIAEREQTIQAQLREFIADLDTGGVAVELVATTADDTEKALLEVAASRKMDVIVVGSRGTGSIFLLGSTAERILHNSPLPVMIVKEKGETVRILDALFGSG